MSFTATVENDTIKLPPGMHLPNGTRVIIVPPGQPIPAEESQRPTLLEAFGDLVGSIKGTSSDLAENHDHYAHGAPKGIDRL